MKLHILCIRDRAADVFGQPMFRPSIGAAIRGFADELNRAAQDNVMYQHPEDFDMYDLGVYDDGDGSFVCPTPRQIAVGKDLKVNKDK